MDSGLDFANYGVIGFGFARVYEGAAGNLNYLLYLAWLINFLSDY